MNKHDNFDDDLDEEESEIEEAFDLEDVKSVPDAKEKIERIRGYARAMLEKTKNTNIRISEGDLFMLKSKAAEQGFPYQTLLSSFIHQHARNRIDYNVLREPGKPYRTKPIKSNKR